MSKSNPKVEFSTTCPACKAKLKDVVDPGDYVLTCPKCGYSGTATLTGGK